MITAMETEEQIYYVLRGTTEGKLTEKGSKFIAFCVSIASEEQAMSVLKDRSRQHHDASHYCWAFRIGAPKQPLEKYSDAGEPSGTAGRPILDQIKKAELYNTICIVTRWFGGVKLGKGGLVRAYGDTAALALAKIKRIRKRPMQKITVKCAYDLIGLVEKHIAKYEGNIVESEFGAEVKLTLALPEINYDRFREDVFDDSKGRVEFT